MTFHGRGTVSLDDAEVARGDAPFEHTVTTTFTVAPVTRFGVFRKVEHDAPCRGIGSIGDGELVCECETESDAQRIAKLLADGLVP